MSRIIMILLIGLGGYVIFQYRYRMVNILFRNRLIQRAAISLIMSIPFFKNRMVKTLFAQPHV